MSRHHLFTLVPISLHELLFAFPSYSSMVTSECKELTRGLALKKFNYNKILQYTYTSYALLIIRLFKSQGHNFTKYKAHWDCSMTNEGNFACTFV